MFTVEICCWCYIIFWYIHITRYLTEYPAGASASLLWIIEQIVLEPCIFAIFWLKVWLSRIIVISFWWLECQAIIHIFLLCVYHAWHGLIKSHSLVLKISDSLSNWTRSITTSLNYRNFAARVVYTMVSSLLRMYDRFGRSLWTNMIIDSHCLLFTSHLAHRLWLFLADVEILIFSLRVLIVFNVHGLWRPVLLAIARPLLNINCWCILTACLHKATHVID